MLRACRVPLEAWPLATPDLALPDPGVVPYNLAARGARSLECRGDVSADRLGSYRFVLPVTRALCDKNFLKLRGTFMVLTPSTMLPLGTAAPDFALPNIHGRLVRLDDFADAPALLVMFWCNHCPYVKHVADAVEALVREYQSRGLAVVAISANDIVMHPDDAPEKMHVEAQTRGYTFDNLYDASQRVAQAYRAACTPDFFLFDAQRHLVYRGQLDDSRPGNGQPVTGADLRGACDALLTGAALPTSQKPSVGCNIKWRAGNAPEYFG